ncbi:MAG TPA: c-type cytochrome [Burkholderiales bacterium]|nr:c-type cytochrome [Burkholderiales bacterium]
MKSVMAGLFASALASVVGSAWAQDPAAARSLVSACFTCHGPDGRSVDGVPPALAGLDRAYLLQTLRDYKAGRRAATIMDQQAKGYTDEEFEVIADYFSRLKPGRAIAAPAPRQ